MVRVRGPPVCCRPRAVCLCAAPRAAVVEARVRGAAISPRSSVARAFYSPPRYHGDLEDTDRGPRPVPLFGPAAAVRRAEVRGHPPLWV